MASFVVSRHSPDVYFELLGAPFPRAHVIVYGIDTLEVCDMPRTDADSPVVVLRFETGGEAARYEYGSHWHGLYLVAREAVLGSVNICVFSCKTGALLLRCRWPDAPYFIHAVPSAKPGAVCRLIGSTKAVITPCGTRAMTMNSQAAPSAVDLFVADDGSSLAASELFALDAERASQQGLLSVIPLQDAFRSAASATTHAHTRMQEPCISSDGRFLMCVALTREGGAHRKFRKRIVVVSLDDGPAGRPVLDLAADSLFGTALFGADLYAEFLGGDSTRLAVWISGDSRDSQKSQLLLLSVPLGGKLIATFDAPPALWQISVRSDDEANGVGGASSSQKWLVLRGGGDTTAESHSGDTTALAKDDGGGAGGAQPSLSMRVHWLQTVNLSALLGERTAPARCGIF